MIGSFYIDSIASALSTSSAGAENGVLETELRWKSSRVCFESPPTTTLPGFYRDTLILFRHRSLSSPAVRLFRRLNP